MAVAAGGGCSLVPTVHGAGVVAKLRKVSEPAGCEANLATQNQEAAARQLSI